MSKGIEIKVQNKLAKEKRDLNVYHHANRSANLLGINSRVTLPLRTAAEGDYIHISLVRDAGWVHTDRYNWNHEAYLFVPCADEKCNCIENVKGARGQAFIHICGAGNDFIPEDPEIPMALPIAAKLRIPAMSMFGVPAADTPTRNYYSTMERGETFLITGIGPVHITSVFDRLPLE